MSIVLDNILKIEQALGVKLYDIQKNYILYDDESGFTDRGQGKTLAHMIKLALSDCGPIDMNQFGKYTDQEHPNGDYTTLYKREFINLRNKLKETGLIVRELTMGPSGDI